MSSLCGYHYFLPFVNYACITFPIVPHDSPVIRIRANNIVDENISSVVLKNQQFPEVDPLYIDIHANSDPIPEYIVAQDPSSPDNWDKLIGIATDGFPIYAGLSINGFDVFRPPSNSDSFRYQIDGCGGSYGPTPTGWRYHYRTIPACTLNNATSSIQRNMMITEIHELLEGFEKLSVPRIVGYSITGYPIYSPLDSDGKLHTGLDNCNGKFDDNNKYGYYTTISFPYVIGCDGPGVYNSNDLTISMEGIPPVVGRSYVQCPGGSFPSASRLTTGCELCPAGRYSITSGSTLLTACSGVCPAGHFCPAGSVKSIQCPGGSYGASTGLTSPVCSGVCEPGYYCPPGSTSSNSYPCGNITSYCPVGSTRRLFVDVGYYTWPEANDSEHLRSAQLPCEPGYYCTGGKRYLCLAGTYGSTSKLNSSDCSDSCPPGYYCPANSVAPIICPAGRHGNSSKLMDANCSGLCSPGYYCPSGSTSSTQISCPPGIFGAEFGLTTAECSLNCEKGSGNNLTSVMGLLSCISRSCAAGYICPAASTSATQQPCGGADVYCPPHSVLATPLSSGYYTIGPLSSPQRQNDNDALVRTSQVQCEPGYWCANGIRQPCDRGSFGGYSGQTSSLCSGDCLPGYICDYGSSSPKQYPCGQNSSVYCPAGSFQPMVVPDGYYSVGESDTTRSHILPCPPGKYCVGGVEYPCAAGRYSAKGSSTSDCDGLCSAGYYCPPMSTSSTQIPCPAGRFGAAGMTSSHCAGGCTAGYYCPAASTSPMQFQCGGEYLYCPRESGSPLAVTLLHYSTGGTTLTRTAQELCVMAQFLGTPPAGNARSNICPSTTVMH